MTVTLKVNLPAPTRRTARNALVWLVAWVLLASIATAAMTMTKPAGTSLPDGLRHCTAGCVRE